MGVGPVTRGTAKPQSERDYPGNWRLAGGIDHDAQGLVVSGYAALPFAVALFLNFGAKGSAWLKALRETVKITPANERKQKSAAAIAFTSTGLAEVLPEDIAEGVLLTFALPFQEGMLQKSRSQRLGDTGESLATPVPEWSGNGQKGIDRDSAVITALTVHGLLILYDENSGALGPHADSVKALLAEHQVKVVREILLDLQADANGIPHEHFGFADGISQPIPFGPGTTTKYGGEYPRDPVHGVPLGEILLGYENAHGEIPPGPIVVGALGYEDARWDPDDPGKQSKGSWPRDPSSGNDGSAASLADKTTQANGAGLKALGLTQDSAVHGDLGRNGTYLVVRELKQDVVQFWKSMDREAQSLNECTGGSSVITADWLAARIVGRTKDGALLCPGGQLAPDAAGQPKNDALFFQDDRNGIGCPLGSHVRRSNPRDGLAKDQASCADILHAANNHRILRRGRKFGPPVKDPREDYSERGLLFMCINTDIERQFEFIQQNWVLNQHFATLFGEADPLVGRRGPMTLPAVPLRRTVNVDTYVTFIGGEYFFLPSICALNYFEALQPAAGKKAAGRQ
jgi:Dyp-type peroxidase family